MGGATRPRQDRMASRLHTTEHSTHPDRVSPDTQNRVSLDTRQNVVVSPRAWDLLVFLI